MVRMIKKSKAKETKEKKSKAAARAKSEKPAPKKAGKPAPAKKRIVAKEKPLKKERGTSKRPEVKEAPPALPKERKPLEAKKIEVVKEKINTIKTPVEKKLHKEAITVDVSKKISPEVKATGPKEGRPIQAEKPAEEIRPAEKPKSAETIIQPEKPKEAVEPIKEPIPVEEVKPKVLEVETPITLKELAAQLGIKANELILNLMAKNVFATINQNLGEDVVKGLLKDFGIEYKRPVELEGQAAMEHRELEEKQDVRHLVHRPPVVTFMGHVDHGKTSLLDFIRKTRVADKEKGGITQHIGAYEVKFKNGSVTFLDTPGHEAFTAMRARGANATDIVVLVVAADDGVMPQTKEAVDHARAAGVPIVVALNKSDLPSANIEKVKGQLSQLGLAPEDWGGKTITVPVSAKTGIGVDNLLEMLLLEAELLELKSNPHLRARGVVIEGKLSSGQGPVATVLVKNGTLKVGDIVLSGMHYGKIKAMMDDKGVRVDAAATSKPVSILGLSGVPMAGDQFFVVKDEKKAKVLSLLKQDEERARRLKMSKRVTLEDFYAQLKDGIAKELAIVLKGDVQGSVEAIKKSLQELNAKDVSINIIHADVGNINESDVMLAAVSNSVVMGFNVKIDEGAQELAAKEGIEIKVYGIIYEAIQDVMAAMEGLLEPYSKEVFVGRAQVKQVFKVSKVGTVAGCLVVKGKIVRTGIAKLIRDKAVVYEGKISSLKRFKDDVREVNEGFECGIALERHDEIKVGDLIEIYTIEKVARRLESRKRE
ncbi:MAG: translation initiation factor IF-2 [Omnitrophica bacterium RIFCSPLOWO2_01_FULL_45_10]|nr:MAG: translation initiation factor IF-2 [Omnitrophica bacterium RIFCSPLOWO2_01_FULL_45_10]